MEQRIEVEEDMKPNMYNTLFESAMDVLDTVNEDDFLGEWKGNEFFYLVSRTTLIGAEYFKDRMAKYLLENNSWESSDSKEVIVVSLYDIHNKEIEKIKPSAVVFVSDKYQADEVDRLEVANANIYYYGSHADRFIRFLKKYGLAVKL